VGSDQSGVGTGHPGLALLAWIRASQAQGQSCAQADMPAWCHVPARPPGFCLCSFPCMLSNGTDLIRMDWVRWIYPARVTALEHTQPESDHAPPTGHGGGWARLGDRGPRSGVPDGREMGGTTATSRNGGNASEHARLPPCRSACPGPGVPGRHIHRCGQARPWGIRRRAAMCIPLCG
jgi:hypothetical protein